MLYDTLYFPDSPVNVISVSKLALDYRDSKMSIQSFSTYLVFTWNYGENMIPFQHSISNLPEIVPITNFNPLYCLASSLYESTI